MLGYKCYTIPKRPENLEFDLAKVLRFDLSKQCPCYNIGFVLKVYSLELSLRSKTKF